MMNTSEGKLYVSDPTHKLDSISIEIPADYSVSASEFVAVNGTAVTVDTSKYTGEVFVIELICEHDNVSDWTEDGENHWKTCDNCGKEVEVSAHEFEWIVDQEATETVDGQKHEKCSVCGRLQRGR